MSDCGQCGRAVCDCYLDIGYEQTVKAAYSKQDCIEAEERWSTDIRKADTVISLLDDQ